MDDSVKYEASHGNDWWPRISEALAYDLVRRWYGRWDYWPIIDVINSIEGSARGSSAKRPARFRAGPLEGLWHAHVFYARHIPRNIVLESMRPKEEAPMDLHELVIGGYQRRAGRKALTGDWLIFGKHDGANYYLAVVEHPEGRSGDDLIYEFLRVSCGHEFPFLLNGKSPLA